MQAGGRELDNVVETGASEKEMLGLWFDAVGVGVALALVNA